MKKPEKKIADPCNCGDSGCTGKGILFKEELGYNKAYDDWQSYILALINDDAFVIQFQTVGQYRKALIDIIKGS